MNDFTQGVLEGLAYSRTLLKADKRSAISAKIARRILEESVRAEYLAFLDQAWGVPF